MTDRPQSAEQQFGTNNGTLHSPAEVALDALPKALNEIQRLYTSIEEICQLGLTPPKTRAQLRHLVAGVDWRKVR